MFIAELALAQTTIILKPNGEVGKDAFIGGLNPTMNLSEHPDFVAMSGTNGGIQVTNRGIIDFDLSEIPENANIISASLSLFSYDSPWVGTHRLTDGKNDCFLYRVTEEWLETQVNWTNQPSITNLNRVYYPSSTADIQDYLDVDVSALVQDMVNDPNGSHGFLLQQIMENPYRTMCFASSDNDNAELWPELKVVYLENPKSDECVRFTPNAEDGKDTFLRSLDPDVNRSLHPDFNAQTGTNNSQLVSARGIIDFELNSLPENIEIVTAKLNLFSYNSMSNGTHAAYDGGNNQAELRRVTEFWEEDEVTWNNQPSVTNQNMIILEETELEILDYTLDMKNMVIDYLNDKNNSFGFMIKQTDEAPYGRLIFGSSDNIDPELRPSMEVCYNIISSTEFDRIINFNVYPVPAANTINVELDKVYEGDIKIYTIGGILIKELSTSGGINQIDIKELVAGEYIIKVTSKISKRVTGSKQFIKL